MLEASPDKDPILEDVVSRQFSRDGTHGSRAGYSIAVISGRANETVQFFQGGDTGNSMFRENTHWYENDTPVTRITSTLDLEIEASFVEIRRVDILKIDVQGAELMVLKGGFRVLEAATFVQLQSGTIEYNAGGCWWFEIDDILRSHGFYLYDIGELAYNPAFFKTTGAGQFDMLYVKATSPNLPKGLQPAKFCGFDKNETKSETQPEIAHQEEKVTKNLFDRLDESSVCFFSGILLTFILEMLVQKVAKSRKKENPYQSGPLLPSSLQLHQHIFPTFTSMS